MYKVFYVECRIADAIVIMYTNHHSGEARADCSILMIFSFNVSFLSSNQIMQMGRKSGCNKHVMIRYWILEPKSRPQSQNGKITVVKNYQNTKRTYGQPNGQLFTKRWPLRNQNRTKNNMSKHKVKTMSSNRIPQQATQNYRLESVSNELLGL